VSRAVPASPPRRHRRRSWRELELVSLDFEATGLDFAKDTIVSFGTVPIRRGRVDLGDAGYDLVDPGPVSVSSESVTVHGLRPVDLRGAPDLDAARTALGAAIAGRFLVAWAAGVEAAFLDRMFGGGVRRWLRRFVDARPIAFATMEDPPRPFTLTSVAERHGVPVASPHHALDDALVTAQLFLVVAARLRSGRTPMIRDLQRVRFTDGRMRHEPTPRSGFAR
jgi:DNA polymerase-3 subunit epsilon